MGFMSWWGASNHGLDDIEWPAEEPTVTPAGTYQIRVRIVEAKDLSAISAFSLWQSITSLSWKTQVEATNDLPNVVGKVKLKRDGFPTQRRRTVVEKETSNPLWNQLFYFDEVEVEEGELAALSLTLKCVDRTRIGRDLVIGSCDLNLEAVYAEDGHELWYEWLTLTDKKGRRKGAQGAMCVCVTVLHSADDPKTHTELHDSDDDAKEELDGVAVSAYQAKDEVLETWIVKASLYSGRDLPRMDRFGKAGIDAYFSMQCGSSKIARSKTKSSRSPDWNQELILRLVVPPGKGGITSLPPIKLSLMDHDTMMRDDHIATTHVTLRELCTKPDEYKHPKWYTFYGGPREMELAYFTKMSKLAKRMNAGYVEGSAYRGRALVGFQVMKETWSNKGMRPKTNIPSVLETLGREWPCYLHTQIYSIELSQTRHVGRNVSVKLTMGLNSVKTQGEELKSEGRALGKKECYANFNVQVIPMRVPLPTPFDGPLQGQGAPDLFVGVYVGSGKGKKRIGYCRVPCRHLMPVRETFQPIKEPKTEETWKLEGWFQLHADALEDHKTGRSRRAEHAKPLGQILLRVMLQGSPVDKRNAKMMTKSELDRFMTAYDDEDEEKLAEQNRETASQRQAREFEERSHRRHQRLLKETPMETIPPLPTRKYMLQVHLYQAKDLPAADSQGSSDPYAVVRCGRNQAKTQVCKSTTSPGWFREVLMEVDLPLIPPPKKEKKRKKLRGLNPEEDGDADGDGGGDGPDLGIENEESDSEDDVDEEEDPFAVLQASGEVDASGKKVKNKSKTKNDVMTLGQAGALGIGPGQRGHIGGFEGIAWWAAPAMTIVVLDEDEHARGLITTADPLAVISLPLLRPTAGRGRAGPGQIDGRSTLASSASAYTDISLSQVEDVVPNQFTDLSQYQVGLLEPEWRGMKQLNPTRGGGIGVRPGGQILLHYTVKEVPAEGVYAYAGLPEPRTPKHVNIVRELGDVFGSAPVEVQVLLLGCRGMDAFRGLPVMNPCIEVELTGALPLFPGSPFTTQRSKHSSSPSGSNANYGGQMLRLRGRVHALEMIELALAVRVIDRVPFHRVVGTGEYRLKLREEDDDDDDPNDPTKRGNKGKKRRLKKLRPAKAKGQGDGNVDALFSGMSETESEGGAEDAESTTSGGGGNSSSETEAAGSDAGERESHGAGARGSYVNDDDFGMFSRSIDDARPGEEEDRPSAESSKRAEKRKSFRKRVSQKLASVFSSGGKSQRSGDDYDASDGYSDRESGDDVEFGVSAHEMEAARSLSRKGSGRRYVRARSSATKSKNTTLAGMRERASKGDGSKSAGVRSSKASARRSKSASKSRSKKTHPLETLAEEGDSGDDGTVADSLGTSTDEFSTDDDRDSMAGDAENERLREEKAAKQRAEVEAELAARERTGGAGDEFDDQPTFDDGTGELPEFMIGRMIATGADGGTLEDHMQPLPFITIPIYRSGRGGFVEHSAHRVEGGKVKFAVRVVPLSEREAHDELLDDEPLDAARGLKKFKGAATKALGKVNVLKAIKQREMRALMREDSKFVPVESMASVKKEDFADLQRLVSGQMDSSRITVRTTIIRGKNMRPLDLSGLCDPYVRIELEGTKKSYGSFKDHVKETLAPWFYKTYEFQTELPGPSQMVCKVLDYDKGGKDDLIGSTTIDLEDRWFSDKWNADFAALPPLEMRRLSHPTATGSQGLVELFVEIFEEDGAIPRLFDVKPPEVIEVEMRVCVFKARGLVNKDFGGTNDAFVKCGLVGIDHKQTRFSETRETDTHYFSDEHKASFNYRLVYRFTLPVLKAKLRISAFDRDMIISTDSIGEAVIPLTSMCQDLMRLVRNSPEGVLSPKAAVEMSLKTSGSFLAGGLSALLDGADSGVWVPLYHPSKGAVKQGEVEIRIDMLPVARAEIRPVGKGRNQPNRDPELPEPIRKKLSLLDPLGALATILGPEFMRKFLIITICMACTGGAGYLAVMFANDFFSAYVTMWVQKASGTYVPPPSPPSAPTTTVIYQNGSSSLGDFDLDRSGANASASASLGVGLEEDDDALGRAGGGDAGDALALASTPGARLFAAGAGAAFFAFLAARSLRRGLEEAVRKPLVRHRNGQSAAVSAGYETTTT